MINITTWKKSPGYSESGFDKLKKFLRDEGATQQGSRTGDLYDDAEFKIKPGVSVKKFGDKIKKKFPNLAEVKYDSTASDPQFNHAGPSWGQGSSIDISYNKNDSEKSEKKGATPK